MDWRAKTARWAMTVLGSLTDTIRCENAQLRHV